jgi:hypothetical protein
MLALGVARAATEQVMPPLPKPQPGYVFPAKQTLNYAVDWRVFPAGVASFHLSAQGDIEQVSVEADTVGAVNLLFRVTDRFQSSFNRTTGCSQSFAKQLIEGRRRVNSTLTFNYTTGKSLFTQQNLVSGTNERRESSIPACATDSLSAIFYAASQTLEVGKSFEFPLADAARTVKVTMQVEGHDEITTPAGTFQTVRVEPTADAGVVKSRGNIWIWYTNDARHIPVQMRARLFWGTITFRLISLESK